MNKCAHNMNYT